MRRMRNRLVPFVLVALVVGGPALRAETPAQLARTARYVEGLQNPDGGFAATPGGPSSLGSTSSAIRTLGFVGGSIPDVEACRKYVLACYDASSGGFRGAPGDAPPDVITTAVGLMAVAELGKATPEMIEASKSYLFEHAKEFEEVRLAVAGLEAAGVKPIENPTFAEVLSAGQNADGTWGEGASRAFATGGRAAGLLRMGKELANPEAVAEALKDGQRDDGAWSKDEGPTDLPATYRIMRALYMMKATPDLDALRAYIGRCRNEDGSYRTAPGREDSGGTYYATIVLRWSRLLGGEPAVVETAGFDPLLEGDDLSGWDGDRSLWRAEAGTLIGESPGIRQNEFLVAPGTYRDFVLKFTFRLKGGAGNSGVQFRSVRVPDSSEMSGYQADIGEGYWGSLYDESRRNRTLAQASARALEALRPDAWNEYAVRCMGGRITLYLNGVPSVDYREEDPAIAREGRVAFQIHAGGPMRVEFKDILIQPLPTPAADESATPGFHLRTSRAEAGRGRKYTVYLPEGYDGKRRFPVILFLHGSGERGDDGAAPAQVGLGPILLREPGAYPFIAVFPQARETWGAGSEDAAAALAALDEVLADYEADRSRVILTGLSMGGFGTWQLGSSEPARFVALAPVCGFSEASVVPPIVEAKLPVWSSIGDADSTRLVDSTRALVAALRDAGADPRETEFRGVRHNSWDRAYSNPELQGWLRDRVK
jgi:dienelactone hydrolase